MRYLEIIIDGNELKKVIKNPSGIYTILDGISLEIYKGEFVSVMGPSGSEKVHC